MVENGAVQGQDDGDDLAAEDGHVADHQEPIGFDDRPADGLVTSTILLEVAAELTSITDTPYGPEMSAGMEFRTGVGNPRESHRNGNMTPTWEWEREVVGMCVDGNPSTVPSWSYIPISVGFPWKWEYDSNFGMETEISGNVHGCESVDYPELESYSHSRGISLKMGI